jgi:hypothetical protein
MKQTNDHAMSIAGIGFGMFCVIAMVGAGIYILSINSQQSPVTDTYGNTVSPVTNTSQHLVGSLTSDVGGATMVPLIILVIVILVIAAITAIWLATKAQ